VTWHCRHIANPAVQRHIAEYLEQMGLLEKSMLSDEIVEDVRAIREAPAAKFGYDLRTISADLKNSEAERIAAGHPFVSPPSEPLAPNSALQRTRFAHR